MFLDLHLHSEYSWDSNVSIRDYINLAEHRQFNAISVTDHNSIESHSLIDKLQDQTEVLLIPGQEVSTADGHLLVYGWIDTLPQNLTMKNTVDLAKKGDTICIAAHPFDPLRGGSFSKIYNSNLDGFEILNASAWFGITNYLAKKSFIGQDRFGIGLANSDSHRIEEFATAYSVSDYKSEEITMANLYNHLLTVKPAGNRIGLMRKTHRFLKRKFF